MAAGSTLRDDCGLGRGARGRRLLGRMSAIALVAGIAGCGSAVRDDSALTVYMSVPLSGGEAEIGRAAAAGAEQALEEAGGEAAGATLRLEVEDSDPAGGDPQQARIAAIARTASRDSTAIAYLGESQAGGTRISIPITNEAGIPQVALGPVDPEILAVPGGNGVPDEFQPTGERTLVALAEPGRAPTARAARAAGREAMALIVDAIDRAADPLSRASVTEALLETRGRESPLGTYTIGPNGLATFES